MDRSMKQGSVEFGSIRFLAVSTRLNGLMKLNQKTESIAQSLNFGRNVGIVRQNQLLLFMKINSQNTPKLL